MSADLLEMSVAAPATLGPRLLKFQQWVQNGLTAWDRLDEALELT